MIMHGKIQVFVRLILAALYRIEDFPHCVWPIKQIALFLRRIQMMDSRSYLENHDSSYS